ncbi:helix-turn-helix domain-containing protein [Patescibacteria group bacterium]|nr:helix-turn-helix domain-containing protein [Patescibacteria group bacterium]
MRNYTHFSQEERETLYDLLQIGINQNKIGNIIGKSSSSVSREIKRNSSSIERKHNNSPKKIKYYLPHKAQKKYKKRRKESKYPFPLKKPKIFKYVIGHLTSFECWSPDSISGRIENDIGEKISTECIYQFIYSKRTKHLELWKYLRRAHKKDARKRAENTEGCSFPAEKIFLSDQEKLMKEKDLAMGRAIVSLD